MKVSTSVSSKIISLVVFILLLVLIAIISGLKDNAMVYPSLETIFNRLTYNLSHLTVINAFLYTFLRILITIVLAFISALVIALLYYLKPLSLAIFRPLLIIMKAAPLAAISIYIFIIAGGNLGPYIITYLLITPILVEGLVGAIEQIPNGIVNELKLTSGPRVYQFFRIYFPMMFPNIIISLLQVVGLSFKVMIMAEYLCQCKTSIGIIIYQSFSVTDMANLIAIIIEVIAIVVIGEYIIKKIQNKLQVQN